MYPALAVWQAFDKEASTILWVGGEGGMEEDLVKRAGLPYTSIPAAGVHGVGLGALPGNLVRLARGVIASREVLYDFKPDVVFFTGGYVGVPMAVAARGIPSLVYVPDIEPGLALKFLGRFATRIALTTETSRQFFQPTANTTITGYPLRTELKDWNRASGRAHLGLDPDRFTLLVTGGSKGAQTLNRPLLAILPQLLADMQIVHISGKIDWPEAEKAKSSLSPELAEHYHPFAYLHDMGAALAAADLAVSRAGASTLGEYPFFGLPAILVPYPFAWRYQKVNASYLVEHQAAILVQNDDLPDQLLPTVQMLARDSQKLAQMSKAMRSLAYPTAAEEIARNLMELAGENENQ